MALNVKTRWARAIWQKLLEKPAGQRHGITGFWIASLPRSQSERLVRVAYLPEGRFVFEADIDPADTHVMTASRMQEYIEHERLKFMEGNQPESLEQLGDSVRQSMAQGRIVVAFRDARAYEADTHHTNQNPIWYTDE